MTIAIPLTSKLSFYHNNPFTAPKIAIYTIKKESQKLLYAQSKIIDNPWGIVNNGEFQQQQIVCECPDNECMDIQHITEHYALTDAIAGCSYLLAGKYCENVFRTVNNCGIEIFQIPPIINSVENAIKNFILGVSLADKLQHIHYAS